VHAIKAKVELWFVLLFLNFSIKLKSVVSNGKRALQCPLNGRLCGHQRRSGDFRPV